MPLTDRDHARLATCHPDLRRVIIAAGDDPAYPLVPDFMVIQGVRTLEEQKVLFRAGKSQTMRSRHLPDAEGFSRAVDLGMLVDGVLRWDADYYTEFWPALQAVATLCNVPLEWGGNWRSFRDLDHFQLPESLYPDPTGEGR